MAEIQAQIEDTTGVMRSNLQAMAERGESISTLEGKTSPFSLFLLAWRVDADEVGQIT